MKKPSFIFCRTIQNKKFNIAFYQNEKQPYYIIIDYTIMNRKNIKINQKVPIELILEHVSKEIGPYHCDNCLYYGSNSGIYIGLCATCDKQRSIYLSIDNNDLTYEQLEQCYEYLRI
jgi:hypothetical protein